MRVTVTTPADYTFPLEVSDDLELENFKALCEIESGFPTTEMVISFNGQPLLDDKKTLTELGIKDGDMVMLQHISQAGGHQAARTRPQPTGAPAGMKSLYRKKIIKQNLANTQRRGSLHLHTLQRAALKMYVGFLFISGKNVPFITPTICGGQSDALRRRVVPRDCFGAFLWRRTGICGDPGVGVVWLAKFVLGLETNLDGTKIFKT